MLSSAEVLNLIDPADPDQVMPRGADDRGRPQFELAWSPAGPYAMDVAILARTPRVLTSGAVFTHNHLPGWHALLISIDE